MWSGVLCRNPTRLRSDTNLVGRLLRNVKRGRIISPSPNPYSGTRRHTRVRSAGRANVYVLHTAREASVERDVQCAACGQWVVVTAPKVIDERIVCVRCSGLPVVDATRPIVVGVPARRAA